MLIAVYHLQDLEAAFHAILGDGEFLMMYCLHDSYMWQCKREIVALIDQLKGKQIFNECRVLEEFKQYMRDKQRTAAT